MMSVGNDPHGRIGKSLARGTNGLYIGVGGSPERGELYLADQAALALFIFALVLS